MGGGELGEGSLLPDVTGASEVTVALVITAASDVTAAPRNSNVTPEEEETVDENDAAVPDNAQEENSMSIGDG